MNTNTLMRDENIVKIEWTDDIGSPVMVDGAPVPSARFWEAIIDGVSEDKAVKLAVDSAVYRTELKRVYVVTDRVKTTDTVGVRGKDFTLVERTEETRVRPFAVGAMARFEVTPTPCSMMALFYYAKETHGHCPVAMVDKKVFFAKEEQQSRLLNRFGIKGGMKDNAHLLVRMGVLMKRPGGLRQTLNLPTGRFSEAENDGTIVISKDVDAPRPGTMLVEGDTPLYFKGMVRGPLTIDGVSEAEGTCQNAQFGQALPDGEFNATFYGVRTLPKERTSLNYQAGLFGAEHPEELIRTDNQRLKKFKLSDLFTQEEMRKVNAGVPPALLMRQYAPWKWLGQMQVRGARATVYGSDLVPVGHVRMLPETYRAFRTTTTQIVELNGRTKADAYCRVDTVHHYPSHVVLHRDPASPDASSMALYQLDGVAEWSKATEDADRRGIVLNPRDPQWKAAGGDFDGDAAVAFRHDFELKERVGTQNSLKQKQGIGLIQYKGESSVPATLIRMANGFTGKLGPAVMAAMRIRERLGYIDDEVASEAQCVVQAAVDAKKHPVNTREGYKLFAALRERVKEIEPEHGFFLDQQHKVKRAKGERAKVEAWKELVAWCDEHRSEFNAVEMEMAQRVVLLDAIFAETEWLRGDRVVLPNTIRDGALAWLMENPDAYQQTELVMDLSREYRTAARLLSEAGDDEEREVLREKAQSARLQIRLALRSGEVSPAAMIAWGPGRLAAELLKASDFEELGGKATFMETVLFGQWEDGTYSTACLDPTPKHHENCARVLEEVKEVELKVLHQSSAVARVLLRW